MRLRPLRFCRDGGGPDGPPPAPAGMNFCIHKAHSQSVADGSRFSSAFENLNQIVPVIFVHKGMAGVKQAGRALPLSRQYAAYSGTPKPPHPVNQRQNFVECRRLDFFKEATPGIAGLTAAATIIFSHGYACIPLEITSKIYLCCLLSNCLALSPGFSEVGRIGHFAPQFSAIIRRRGTHQTKTAPTSHFAAVFRGIFRKRRIASQGNIYKLPTQRTGRPDVRDFQAGTLHQMYGLAHEKAHSTTPDLRAFRGPNPLP